MLMYMSSFIGCSWEAGPRKQLGEWREGYKGVLSNKKSRRQVMLRGALSYARHGTASVQSFAVLTVASRTAAALTQVCPAGQVGSHVPVPTVLLNQHLPSTVRSVSNLDLCNMSMESHLS